MKAVIFCNGTTDLQKKSLIAKAVFNTYFAIRTPEEKFDERSRVLKAYDWEKNEVLNVGGYKLYISQSRR